MSKQQIKKFRKNDYSYEDEEESSYNAKSFINKRKEKRVERALRMKDIPALIENDDEGLDPIDIEDEIWDDEIFNQR
jgi:hypothetical protein